MQNAPSQKPSSRASYDVTTIWLGKAAHRRIKNYADARGMKLRFAVEQALNFFLDSKELEEA